MAVSRVWLTSINIDANWHSYLVQCVKRSRFFRVPLRSRSFIKKRSGTPISLLLKKREWHSLIALSWKECTLLSLFFCNFFKDFFLTSIHTWIWKFTRNFMSSWKYLCFQEYINHRSDGETSLFTEKESQKKRKFQEKKSERRGPLIFSLSSKIWVPLPHRSFW